MASEFLSKLIHLGQRKESAASARITFCSRFPLKYSVSTLFHPLRLKLSENNDFVRKVQRNTTFLHWTLQISAISLFQVCCFDCVHYCFVVGPKLKMVVWSCRRASPQVGCCCHWSAVESESTGATQVPRSLAFRHLELQPWGIFDFQISLNFGDVCQRDEGWAAVSQKFVLHLVLVRVLVGRC